MPYYISKNLLFADLTNRLVYLTDAPFFIFPFLCLLLAWLIGKKMFTRKQYGLIPLLVLIINPWFWYLSLANSFYILALVLVLAIIYGIIQINSGDKFSGSVFIAIAYVTGSYFSAFLFIYIPIVILFVTTLNILRIKKLGFTFLFSIVFLIPLVVMILGNRNAFIGAFKKDLDIFKDPGIVNTANRYQGAASQSGLYSLSRISQNKYIFYAEHFTKKYLERLTPATYFTQQNKLLGFSFSPPVFAGFLIPFAYGLSKMLENKLRLKTLLISTFLIVPSVLTNSSDFLNRLIIFFPVIIYLISHGIADLFEKRKRKNIGAILVFIAIAVLVQFLTTAIDIKNREAQRYQRYFGEKYALNE